MVNFNHTYIHLASGQRVSSNLTMENNVLGHHVQYVSKVFWMPIVGEELPLAQENAIKPCKYGSNCLYLKANEN